MAAHPTSSDDLNLDKDQIVQTETETEASLSEIDEGGELISPDALSSERTPSSNWAVLTLPQFVFLKGHNGKYLVSRFDGNRRTSFFTADKKINATVFEMVSMSDGSVRIKSTFYDRFLGQVTRNGDLLAEFTDSVIDTANPTTRFWPVRVARNTPEKNLIGFRLVNNQGELNRCYPFAHTSVFTARTVAMGKAMAFELEEAVSQREIYGVTYFMDQAMISDHEPLTSVTKDVKNFSSSTQKGVLRFSYTETETHTWSSTDTWKVAASVKVSLRIPFFRMSVSAEAYYSGSYEWGEAQATSKEVSTQLELEVPPMTMVQATMLVQKGKLTVPFSYGQRDALYNGYSNVARLQDGLFTGENTYITFETIQRPLTNA